MSDAFNTALQQAKQMYRPERQDISVVEIQLGMAGGGGLYPLIKRSSGSNISTGSLGSRDAGGSGPWDAWSPPDEPRIQYQPVPQQATVPDMSSGMMRSYFQNLVGEEEEGYNPLYRKEGGGLSSIQKQINIGGEPHRLSYINSDEASLLRQMGGSGKSVNGVPAYFWDVGDDLSGAGWDVGKDTDIGTGKDEGGNNISRDDKPKSPGFLETVYQHFFPAWITPRELDEEQARHNWMVDHFSGIAYGTDGGPAGWSGFGVGKKGGGGLSSIQKKIDIGGEPHRLSYINSDEASLLKQLGGSGRNVNGIPAYYFDDQDFSESWSDPGDTSSDSQDIDEAAPTSQEGADLAALGTQADADAEQAAQAWAAAEIDREARAGLEALSFPMSLEEDAKEIAQAKAALEADKGFVPTTPEAHRDYLKKRRKALLAREPHHTSKTYWGLSEEEIQAKREKGEFFVNVNKEGVSDYYGPIGKAPDDPWQIYQDNLAGAYHQAGTVFSSNLPEIPDPAEDWSLTEEKLREKSGAGISSSAMGTLDPNAPESYAHAQQLALEEMVERREKEEAELEKFNRYRVSLGREERDEPVGGWKNPEPYSDPFVDFLGAISWFMSQGLPFNEAFNAIQRSSGSGEHGMEIRSRADQLAGAQALYGLTGYYGPALNREQQEYEKAKEEEWLAGEKFAETLPGDQQITAPETKKEEAEKIKKLSLMAKFFEEEDEDKKKKIWDGFTKDEKKLIEIAYGEGGLPSLIDQIG